MNISELVVTQNQVIITGAVVLASLANSYILILIYKKKNKIVREDKLYRKMSHELEKIKSRGIKVPAETKAEKIKEKMVEKIKSWHPVKSQSRFTVKYWMDWFKEKYLTSKTVLIHMELTNGFHRLFLVVEKDEGFLFRGKKYLFDDDNKYYNIDAKMYCFDYHEGIVLPIKRKIPVSTIKKTIESTEKIDIEYAINPATLQRFMTAKIAEGVMKGTQLDEFLRKLQMFIIVIMVAVLVHLALFIYGSGMLKNINIPYLMG